MKDEEYRDKLFHVYRLADAHTPLVSNQGQALDGYSKLAEYDSIIGKWMDECADEQLSQVHREHDADWRQDPRVARANYLLQKLQRKRTLSVLVDAVLVTVSAYLSDEATDADVVKELDAYVTTTLNDLDAGYRAGGQL